MTELSLLLSFFYLLFILILVKCYVKTWILGLIIKLLSSGFKKKIKLSFTGYLTFIVFLDVCNKIRAAQFQKSNSAVRQAEVFT